MFADVWPGLNGARFDDAFGLLERKGSSALRALTPSCSDLDHVVFPCPRPSGCLWLVSQAVRWQPWRASPPKASPSFFQVFLGPSMFKASEMCCRGLPDGIWGTEWLIACCSPTLLAPSTLWVVKGTQASSDPTFPVCPVLAQAAFPEREQYAPTGQQSPS